MSKPTNNSNEKATVLNAVAELLENQSAKEHMEGLNSLFAGYIRSDFAEIKQDRLDATYVYENFRTLLTRLQELERDNYFQLVQNLKNPEA